MLYPISARICLAIALATIAGTGCSQNQVDSQRKLADAKKELEDAQKKVAAAEAEYKRADAEAKQIPPPVESKRAESPPPPPLPPEPVDITIPAGTVIAIRPASTLSTKTQASGAAFPATLAADLVVGGKLLARKGAAVDGFVVNSDSGGRVKGRASIAVGIRSIDGLSGPIQVKTNAYTAVAKSTVKRDAVRTGIMTGAGAAIGAIAGGGKGAAIGAGVGAGAGVGTTVATKGDPAVIPAEAIIRLRTTAPVTVALSQ